MSGIDTLKVTKRNQIRQEIKNLYQEGVRLARAFQEEREEQFQNAYQSWYTRTLSVIESLAPDRFSEFRDYYQINPKRKLLTYGTFVIQDFVMGISPNKNTHADFDSRKSTLVCFFNQLTILKAVLDRLDSVLSDVEAAIYADLEDNEVVVARQLTKVSLLAAGALMGVLIEGHLQNVASAHNIKIAKANPTIGDLAEPLKAASIIDVPTWRKISYFADIRNICTHKKDVEPTREQVEELINGAEWITKNVF